MSYLDENGLNETLEELRNSIQQLETNNAELLNKVQVCDGKITRLETYKAKMDLYFNSHGKTILTYKGNGNSGSITTTTYTTDVHPFRGYGSAERLTYVFALLYLHIKHNNNTYEIGYPMVCGSRVSEKNSKSTIYYYTPRPVASNDLTMPYAYIEFPLPAHNGESVQCTINIQTPTSVSKKW